MTNLPNSNWQQIISSGIQAVDFKGNLVEELKDVVLFGFQTKVDRFGAVTFMHVDQNFTGYDITNYTSYLTETLCKYMCLEQLGKGAVYLDIPWMFLSVLSIGSVLNTLEFRPYYNYDEVKADGTQDLRVVFYKWNKPNSTDMVPQMGTDIGGAKLMILSSDGKFILLSREKRTNRNGTTTWMYNLPGGGKNRKESHFATVKREAHEEIAFALEGGELRLVGGYSQGNARPGGFNDCFMVFAQYVDPANTKVTPDMLEVDSVVWVLIDLVVKHSVLNQELKTKKAQIESLGVGNMTDLINQEETLTRFKIKELIYTDSNGKVHGLPDDFSMYAGNVRMLTKIAHAHARGEKYGLVVNVSTKPDEDQMDF